MLNLTLPSFPFVVAFAVQGMGWGAGTVGLMAALPHLCNCLQPLLLAALSRRYSNYRILQLTFLMGGVPWLLGLLLPVLGGGRDLVFAGVLIIATLASSVASVAWSTAITDLVPERMGGRYFARRNLIFGAWTLVAVMAAGYLVELGGQTLLVFGVIFALAGLARLAGTFFLSRMTFPAHVREVNSRSIALGDLVGVFKHRNYLWLCLFIGLWGMFLNTAMPFYTVYLVDQMGLGIGQVVTLTTLASLGGLLTLRGWGRLAERFGNRPVLEVSALIWAITALVMWSVARPGLGWHLVPGYVVVGAMTAGFQLVQFNLMVRLAPAATRPAFVAVFLAFTSLLTALGPLLGGQLIRLLPSQVATVFGQALSGFHLVFIGSAVGCLVISRLVPLVHEPAGQPPADVFREMRSMRTFNPMLSLLAVGELLLTPRGLLGLGRRSLRTARQQVKALEDIGEELMEGGKDVLRGGEERK